LVLSLVGFGRKVPQRRISARCKASQGPRSRCDAGGRKGAPNGSADFWQREALLRVATQWQLIAAPEAAKEAKQA